MPLVQDDTEKGTVNFQSAVVVDETQLPELIHKRADTRAGCSDHLGQRFLADLGNVGFGFALIAVMGNQQERPRQTFLTRVEKLIDQVRFNSKVAQQNMSYEEGRKQVLLFQDMHHFSLFNPNHDARSNGGSCRHAHTLARQASLANKAPGTHQCDNRFLAVTRQYRKLHAPSLNVEDRPSGVSLGKDDLSATVGHSRTGQSEFGK